MAEKILIVDDDPQTVKYLSIFLKRLGYETLEALEGFHALQLAHHPAVHRQDPDGGKSGWLRGRRRYLLDQARPSCRAASEYQDPTGAEASSHGSTGEERLHSGCDGCQRRPGGLHDRPKSGGGVKTKREQGGR